jgi:hypothetical protein
LVHAGLPPPPHKKKETPPATPFWPSQFTIGEPQTSTRQCRRGLRAAALAVHPQTNDLLVVDFGAGRVLSVNPNTAAATVFTEVGARFGP